MPAVVAAGLYHIYRERSVETVALRGADIVLDRGSWTSVIGRSGSGKSTLVHVVAGLLEPSGGTVHVEGEEITRLSPNERAIRRRRRVGVVLQRDNLHPLLDVESNVGLALRLDGQSRRAVRERVDELLDAVSLADHRHQPVSQLSGGEAQRVAVAAAVAARPAVLLADELTGELDEESAARVLDLLAALCRDEGAAILTVTHNPLVAKRADAHLEMRDGVLVAAA